MREIGGYIEYEHHDGEEYHKDCIALNSERNCLTYVLEAREIECIMLPRLLCSSIAGICLKMSVRIIYYSVDSYFKPVLPEDIDENIYIINFYGQLENEYIYHLRERHPKLIVDYAQAFFSHPFQIVILYTYRKFFGVADGAYLYMDRVIERGLLVERSYDRMTFLMGRYENTAGEFLAIFGKMNSLFPNRILNICLG